MNHFIIIIEIFKDNEDNDIELGNKLINSLLNPKLYNNNYKKYINKLNHIILDYIQKFKHKFSTCELFLNMILNNHQEEEKDNNDIILKTILINMPDNELSKLLSNLKETQYLKNISKIEIIFNHIIKNMNKYKNNNNIKMKLFEFFEGIIDANKYNDIINFLENSSKSNIIEEKKDNKNIIKDNFNNQKENYFIKFFSELISIIIEISDNYSLENSGINYLDKLKVFLGKINNGKLILGVFKALFFQLYETESNNHAIDNKLKYFDNDCNLDNYELKKVNQDLFKYLCNIFDFIITFIPSKGIIIELFSYFEKIYIKNNHNKNNNNLLCSSAHIFNSQKIIPLFFTYLFTYAQNYNFNNKDKKCLNLLFNNYKSLILFLFYNCSNPPFFTNFKEYLNDTMNFSLYHEFLLEIIQIIYGEKETKKESVEQKNNFYSNSIELLKIIFLSTKSNKTLFLNKQFENLFFIYLNILKDNKMLFSQYFITIQNKNNNDIYKKTILEICAEIIISLSIELQNNIFNKIFIEDNNIKNYLFKNNLKDKNYINEDLKKYFKSQNYTKNRKPIFIQIINIICEYHEKNIENKNIIQLFNEYLKIFIVEGKNNYANWKKYEKENEELKLINNNNEISDIINALVSINKKRINKEKKNINVKEENKIEFNNLDNNENEIITIMKY